MKRLILMKKKIWIENSNHFGSFCSYSPDDLRSIADSMEQGSLIELNIDGHDGYLETRYYRTETDAEYERRLKQEAKDLEKKKIWDAKAKEKDRKLYEKLKKKFEKEKK